MAKESGLGDSLWVDEFDLGGDVGQVQRIGCPITVEEVPGIKMRAQDRLGLLHDGGIDFSAWFNPASTLGAEGAHTVLKGRPTTDRQITYFHTLLQGGVAASLLSKQVTYDGTRGANGSFSFAINSLANGWGLDWGVQLTDTPRTDASATSPATGLDLGASPTSYSQGWAAYLHVKSLASGTATITIQDSANNSAFTSLTDGAFAAVTGAGVQRIASSSATATVRRYARVITTGTFSDLVMAVNFVRYEVAKS